MLLSRRPSRSSTVNATLVGLVPDAAFATGVKMATSVKMAVVVSTHKTDIRVIALTDSLDPTVNVRQPVFN